eukprot:2590397-Rhodomonas_salina.1
MPCVDFSTLVPGILLPPSPDRCHNQSPHPFSPSPLLPTPQANAKFVGLEQMRTRTRSTVTGSSCTRRSQLDPALRL